MHTSIHYFSQYMASEALLKKLVIVSALVLFPSLLIMISWLSNMSHDTTESIWNNLMAGKIHSLLFTPEVLTLGAEKIASGFDLFMFLNVPAALWTGFALTVIYLRNKNTDMSAHQATAWSVALLLLPYIFGLIYIEIIQPPARQVGPPVAFMALSIVYLIPPLAWFVLTKIQNEPS